MDKKLIAVGIVLYNPEEMTRFESCIKSVLEQVDKVYIFDNSTESVVYDFPCNVQYITEGSNKGIAYALNRLMEAAKLDGYLWMVTLDQDSILPKGLIKEYYEVINNLRNIGIVCPQVIDFRRGYMRPKRDPEKEYIDDCITSGSCTSISVWQQIGGFDEWLFIDLVDNEFCKRVICSGYQILRLNKFILNQEFGKIVPKSPKRQKFWIKLSEVLGNENIAKLSYNKYVNPMRVYYTNRNIIYVNRKMRNYGPVGYANYNCKGYIGFLICFCLPSILRAQEKRKVIKAIVAGIRDGSKKRVTAWSKEEKKM